VPDYQPQKAMRFVSTLSNQKARCISLNSALHLGKQHVAFFKKQRANCKMQRAFNTF